MRISSCVAALLLTTVWFGCSSTDNGGGGGGSGGQAGTYTGPISTVPYMNGYTAGPFSVWGTFWEDGAVRDVILDTGSLYLLTAPISNPPGMLPCNDPQKFALWTTGWNGEYCPEKRMFEMIDGDGARVALSPDPLECGDTYFSSDWGTSPFAMLGLSGNISGKNESRVASVIEQLKPTAMSFAWPNGQDNPGRLQFKPLERAADTATVIPLVDPTTLGYGYTARLERIDFIIDDKVHTTVVNRHSESNASKKGVYLIVEGVSQGKVAEDFVSIFNSGSEFPLAWGNGDYSWLDGDVAKGTIIPDSPTAYDSFNAVFKDANGDDVTLKSGPQAGYISRSFQVQLITWAVIPNGVNLLYVSLGLNFVALWDLQFNYDADNWAESVTFFERRSGAIRTH
jgi:hypothetical protein